MRIAILLPGQPRFSDNLNSFVSNITGYNQADWFVYITNNNGNVTDHRRISEYWQTFDAASAYEKIKSFLPKYNFIQSFGVSDDNTQISSESDTQQRNVQKMFYNIYKADLMRQQAEKIGNFKYDLVIRTRSDLQLNAELNLQLNIKNNHVVMPNNNWHAHPHLPSHYIANDQFAIGTSDSMVAYSSVFPNIQEIVSSIGVYHPESMVGYNLIMHNTIAERGNFTVPLCRVPLTEI